jgi:hypothetical protein
VARHEVRLQVPEGIPVGNRDVEFKIESNGEHFGWLKISRGAIVWQPARKRTAFRMGWARFDDLMRDGGREGPF